MPGSYTYDSTSVVVTINGITINDIQGDVQVNRNENMYSVSVDNGGTPTYSKSNNKSGQVILPIAQASTDNDIMSGFQVAEELGAAAPLVVVINDVNGTTKHSGEGRIAKPADASYGPEAGAREWTIEMGILESFLGGVA